MSLDRRQMLMTAAAGMAFAAHSAAAATPAQTTAISDPRLAELFDQFSEEMIAESPQGATRLGLDNGARASLKFQLDDASIAGRKKSLAAYADRKARLSAISRNLLKERDATFYDAVMFVQDQGVRGGQFTYGDDGARPYVISQQDGGVSDVPEFLNSEHSVKTSADAEAYVSRLSAFPRVLDDETARVLADAAAGVVPPDFILATALEQMRALREQAVAMTGLVTSIENRAKLAGLDGKFAVQANKIVETSVFPALDRQIAAISALQTKASHDAGVWRLPKGEDYYAWALTLGTTTNRTPDDIHQLGLDQGAEIDGRMDSLLKAQGMTSGSVGERMLALTRDPKFVFPDSDAGRAALIAYLQGRIAAIRPLLPKLSKLGLKAEVQVKAVPVDIQAGAALGYMNFAALDGSRPAIYYVNLSDMRNWPRHTLASLSAHEAIPGHAWQGAYRAERPNEGPLISSLMGFNAFVEGWALYAEQLVDEAGLYDKDPFGQLGYLQAQRFRAARLVVDTGLHHKRWSREQAVSWMVAATGRSQRAITSEVDRYCASPGQACGYKVGHNEIVRLRQRAQAQLGQRFDLRDFNDAIVTTCGVPLTVLDGVIARYIAAAAKA